MASAIEKTRSEPSIDEIGQRRRGRIWGATVAIIGAASAMLLGAFAPYVGVSLLVASWPLAWLAGWLGRRYGGALRQLDAATSVQSQLSAQSQLDALCALQNTLAKSLYLPLVAASLLIPLSLHLLVVAILGAFSWPHFGAYMTMSAIILIPAYGVLIWQCIRHGRSLAGMSTEPVMDQPGGHALAGTFLASFVPGIVVMGLPPVLVALTGAPFIPAIFRLARTVHEREARAIRHREQDLIDAERNEMLNRLLIVMREDAGLAQQVTAFRILSHQYNRDIVGPVIDDIFDSGRTELLTPALRACRRLHHRPPIQTLVTLARRYSPEAAAAAVKLLVRAHGVMAERALQGLLTAPTREARGA
ncbi:MAG: hypothetical protein AAF449_21045, partial [Myxococcota bacterium]